MKTLAGSIAMLAALTFAAPVHAETPPKYSDVSTATGELVDIYFNAYVGRNWNQLEPLLADGATFQDPTARLLFGGMLRDGKAEMMKAFREGYASISDMSFAPHRVLHTGDYGIFEGDLTWTSEINGLDVTTVAPIVTIIKVEGGRVVEHRDYVDYAPFITSYKAAMAATAK